MQDLASQFLTFCRSKPAREEYDYGAICGCAFHQFLTSAGYPVRSVGGYRWSDTDFRYHDIPRALAGADDEPGALASHPRTFGALADRLAAIATPQTAGPDHG